MEGNYYQGYGDSVIYILKVINGLIYCVDYSLNHKTYNLTVKSLGEFAEYYNQEEIWDNFMDELNLANYSMESIRKELNVV